MADLTELQKKVREVKLLHAKYIEAQTESNAALSRYKRAIVELESLA